MAQRVMNLVWVKLVVILACTMAGGREAAGARELVGGWGLEEFNLSSWLVGGNAWPAGPTVVIPAADDNVCPSSCGAVESSVLLSHVIAPNSIAVITWLIASLPTLLMRSRRKALGVRTCLWQLVLLWLSLLVAYALFKRQRVWGYVWAVHASAHALTAWAPPRRVLVVPFSHRALMLLGVTAVCVFAWQAGPPVGLIAWRGGWTNQCGLTAHFLAVLGVDLVGWALGPLGEAVLSLG